MLLLIIPFHATEIYRLSGGWLISANEQDLGLTVLGSIIQLIRRPIFFFMSGFIAASVLLRKGRDVWMRGRLLQIGVPVVLSSLILVPVENAALAYDSHLSDAHFMATWKELTFQYSDAWIRHRWFLIALLNMIVTYYLLSLGASRLFAKGQVDSAVAWVTKAVRRMPTLLLFGLMLIWGPLGALLNNLLHTLLPLFNIVYFMNTTILYLPFFIVGLVLGNNRDAATAFMTLSRLDYILAAVVMVAYCSLWPWLRQSGTTEIERFLFLVVEMPASLIWLRLIASLCRRFLDYPSRFWRYLAAASYTVYLCHLAYLLFFAALFVRMGLNPWVAAATITFLSTGLCFLTYELVRRSRTLTFIFNGRFPVKANAQNIVRG